MKKIIFLIVVSSMLLSSCGAYWVQKSGIIQEIHSTEDNAASLKNTAQSTKDKKTEEVIMDTAGVKITAKGLEKGGYFGPELKVLIENDTGKDITVQCRDVSVNGFMTDVMFSVDVVNGKKANDGIIFRGSSLEENGITVIEETEFSFHIFDSDSWDTIIDTEPIHIDFNF